MSGRIERVVVQLDAASDNQASIETAVRLAARAGASLHGMFIVDQDLLHLAGLPFARQVTVGAGPEPLTAQKIELEMRAHAERARRDLIGAAKRYGVKCTFEIVQGAGEKATAAERDLVVAGGLSRPVAGHFRVERSWRLTVEAAPGPVLIARTAWPASGELVVLLRDRGPASSRLLEAAAQIASARDAILTVIAAPDLADANGFDQWIAEQLTDQQVQVRIDIVPAEGTAMDERLGQLDCQLLAFETGLVEGDADSLQKTIGRFTCDLLIVR